MTAPKNDRELAAGDYPAALRQMQFEPYFETDIYWDKQQWANRHGAHPDIIRFTEAMVKRCRALSVPVFPYAMVRTPAEQTAEYVFGKENHDGNSPYPHRCFAVDICHCVWGHDLPSPCWDVLGHIGQEVAKSLGIPITWGGEWDWNPKEDDYRLYEPAHFELAHWRSLVPVPPFMSKVSQSA